MKNPSALFIHPNSRNMAGQERSFCHYLGGFDDSFHKVVVLPEEGIFADYIREMKFDLRIIERPGRLTDIPSGVAYVARLIRLGRATGAKFVFSSGIYTNLYGASAAKALRIRSATYVATALYNSWDIRRGAFVKADLFICVSHSAKDSLVQQGIADAACTVIYPNIEDEYKNLPSDPESGASLRRSLHIPSDAIVVGFVGQVIPRKGVDLIVESVKGVISRIPNVKFLVCGDDLDGKGEYLRDVKRMASRLGVEKHFLFTGFLQDVRPVYAASDIIISPSRGEGLNRTVLESLYYCRPIVCSDIPPHREVIEDGVNGVLVKDLSPGGLAERIVSLCLSPCERQNFVEEGKKTFDLRFGAERFHSDWSRAYRSLLGT